VFRIKSGSCFETFGAPPRRKVGRKEEERTAIVARQVARESCAQSKAMDR